MSTEQLIAELDSVVATGTGEQRVELLRRVTDLFLSDADRLTEKQLGVFDDVLVRIMQRVEAKALEQLSTTLAGVDGAPIEAIRQLAYHTEIKVAGPVLRDSNRITDRDLVAIAQARGEEHLLAISGRKAVSADVTDVLLQRGGTRVTHALATNAGAQFSSAGYNTMVERAESDESLTEALGLRLDIPLQMLRQLLARATEAVRERLAALAPPELQRHIGGILTKLAEGFSATKPSQVQYKEADEFVLTLNRSGKLTEAAVTSFALEGETARIIVAISLFCAVKTETIEPLLFNTRSEGLMIACKAAKLSWQTSEMIIRGRFAGITPSRMQIDEARAAYDSISIAAAQRTIRFWAARKVAAKTA